MESKTDRVEELRKELKKGYDSIKHHLRLYAIKLIHAYNDNYDGISKIFGGNLDPEDLINNTVESVLSGKREWPEGMTLLRFMLGVMRSEISHLMEKASRIPWTESFDSWLLEGASTGSSPFSISDSLSTFSVNINQEDIRENIDKRRLWCEFLEYIENDSLCLMLAKLMVNDLGDTLHMNIKTNIEIQIASCLSDEEVVRAKRRLYRKFRKFIDSHPEIGKIQKRHGRKKVSDVIPS